MAIESISEFRERARHVARVACLPTDGRERRRRGARASSRSSSSTMPPTRRSSSCSAHTRRGTVRSWPPASAAIAVPHGVRRTRAQPGPRRGVQGARGGVRGAARRRADLGDEQADRPDDRGVRHARAARPVVPEVLPARRVLLPAVLRAGRRERPRRTGVQGRPRRRRMGARRPEGVDVDGPDRPSTGSPSAAPTPKFPSTPG